MFKWLQRLAFWLLSIWRRIPDKTKREIIEAIVDLFEKIFREYYRRWKRKNGKEK